ncbi:hypothetical protein MHYP_G00269300 [Metynnis hypsauchen]
MIEQKFVIYLLCAEAPVLQAALQKARQTIECQKGEIASFKEKMDLLVKDRYFLCERLKEALALKTEIQEEKGAKSSTVTLATGQKNQRLATQDSSSSEYSEDEKSSQEERMKTPDDSICWYNMVLEKVQFEHISKAQAYARLGIDRNTIVSDI